ncbi:hypothetical protein PLICBS_009032 [Purpureocillium lilacinum]|uniref:uncharacterized protein n=1 Tax=Purpureocillium lilacinum TaxID=33203 RepID=UPI002086DF2A|nr:hypothetical protein PLICBS_009032 [Purpureocillium lilacinum]
MQFLRSTTTLPLLLLLSGTQQHVTALDLPKYTDMDTAKLFVGNFNRETKGTCDHATQQCRSNFVLIENQHGYVRGQPVLLKLHSEVMPCYSHSPCPPRGGSCNHPHPEAPEANCF